MPDGFQRRKRRSAGKNADNWIRKPAGKGYPARLPGQLPVWLALRPYSAADVKENAVRGHGRHRQVTGSGDGPDPEKQRHADEDDEQRQRQAKAGIIAEAIAAGAKDKRVALVADRGKKIATGADRHRHQEGVRPVSEGLRET